MSAGMTAHSTLTIALLSMIASAVGAPPRATFRPAWDDRIAEIVVEGNQRINSYSIILTSHLHAGDLITDDSLADAKRRVFASGQFGANTLNPQDGVMIRSEAIGGGSRVTIQVIENPVVRSIRITNSGPIRVPDIMKRLMTKPGSVLNLQTLQRDVEIVQKLYDERGYQAYVTEKVGLENGILTLPIQVGTLGKIEILGVPKREAERLAREIHKRAGKYANLKRLNEALVSLNLEPIVPEPPAPDEKPMYMTDGLVLRVKNTN